MKSDSMRALVSVCDTCLTLEARCVSVFKKVNSATANVNAVAKRLQNIPGFDLMIFNIPLIMDETDVGIKDAISFKLF